MTTETLTDAETSGRVRRRNAALAREYLDWQRKRNRARETLFIYTDTLNKVLAWIGSTPLAAVSTRTLEQFVERPRRRRRSWHPQAEPYLGAPATRARDVTVLRSFYRYLTERGYVGLNPAVLLIAPTIHNVNPKAIDDDIWRATWAHPSLTDSDRVALGLGYYCGLRRFEIMNLTAAHVDLDGARIVGFPRKGGLHDVFAYGSALALIAQRLPALMPGGVHGVLDPLARLVHERAERPFLLPWGDELHERWRAQGFRPRLDPFPAGWSPPNLWNKRLMRTLARCGLPPDAFTPHSLRHSFVSNLLRADVPLHVVSRLAAHSDIQTTMRYVSTGTDPLASYLATHGDEAPLLARPGRWQ